MPSYQYINSTGVIIPDTSDTLEQVQNDFIAVLGENLSLNPSTPQGVMISSITNLIDFIYNNNALVANQINPFLSQGFFLRSLGSLTQTPYIGATYTTAILSLQGMPNSIVPEGILVSNQTGDIFKSLYQVTLDDSGNGSTTIQALDIGAITSPAGTITNIIEGAVGLETVTNAADALAGSDTESDYAYRQRRIDQIASNAYYNINAFASNLFLVSGVVGVQTLKNDTDESVIEANVLLLPHSVYACVDGGSDIDVATVALIAKGDGVNMNNGGGINKSIQITDPYSAVPYTVLFDRPNPIDILVKVYVTDNGASVDYQDEITNDILNYANGSLFSQYGLRGLTAGVSVSVFQLAQAIQIQSPRIFINLIQITLASSISYSTDEIVLNVFEKANLDSSSIQVIVG